MYIGSMINDSSSMSFKVKEDLTGGGLTAVALSEDGITTATSSDTSLVGIVMAENELPIHKGENVAVQIKNVGMWKIGETIKAGDFLTAGEDGVAMKATSGKFILAQALKSGIKGEAIQVQIIKAGIAS